VTLWNPEVWNGISVVTVVILVGVALVVSLVRGWVIPGRIHREVISGKDAAIKDLRDRAKVDADTIKTQAQTISNRDAMEVATTRLLTAFRDVASAGGET